ncbi:CyP450 monooxygenase [Epithele typhae]|uniref:CyP450 monooxygenase n=1 Tax=Epithele typhae TaxID=378194 RepID=UPI002007D548|nr:CyP450 monooxygenase [Epithele typhae]KAH9937862.1 CyP450 monooxygenase [Epithele typhae]
MGTLVVAALAVLSAAIFLLAKRRGRSATLPLPPGPRPLPFIGNALDMPTGDIPGGLHALCEQYGDIVYLNVLGQHMVVLGTHEAAVDLLEKRSANYSDRPLSPMTEISGFSWGLTSLPYGPWWRRYRRAMHQHFNLNAVERYAGWQEVEAHRLVRRLIDSPEHFVSHIRHFFGSMVLRVTHGLEVDEEEEDFLKVADEALEVFAVVLEPGRYLVEVLPALAYLPSWMPGAGFKRHAASWRRSARRLFEVPWNAAMDAINRGTALPSMAAHIMERAKSLPAEEAVQEEEVGKYATASAYGGGADTTLSTVQTFFVAMLLYPEIQKKAQEELMRVVGPNRLPEKKDLADLPYTQALAKECLRWRTVAPLAVPHRSLEDDEYKGYLIPKGTTILANIWAFSHDERYFSDPDVFKPERHLRDGHLDPDVMDPATIVFGYGRRVCPGQHFAQTSLLIAIATVLHTLDITPPDGPDGMPILPSGKMTRGLLSYPEPFQCKFASRSTEREALLRAGCEGFEMGSLSANLSSS